ncbi:FAD-dependent monooxygenase [Gammaproteobacteria bacterium]|nr:FAD-dependent monooxygenase [Gammaproteobacteria bacterium]
MTDYSNHIAIIGAGISGLALGCMLKKANIPAIIFERSSVVSNYGAGISISPNGRDVLSYLEVDEVISKLSGNPKKALFFSNEVKITSIPSNVITTSRKILYKSLLEKYLQLDGDILFDHELIDIDCENINIFFSNNSSFNVQHVVACDGIKSSVRAKQMPGSKDPSYSGYSVWRAIIHRRQENIETHLGPNYHIVTYPVDESRTSFVAAIKTSKAYTESWKAKGSLEELKEDLPQESEIINSIFTEGDELYRWGVYTRPNITDLYSKNITFLGDAAHPIVPFIGQGGCLALEDAYVFGKLASKFRNNFKKIQYSYQKIRLKRVIKIKNESERQGFLNHLSNPLLVYSRNMFMKYTPIISSRIKKIWTYDPDKEISKI